LRSGSGRSTSAMRNWPMSEGAFMRSGLRSASGCLSPTACTRALSSVRLTWPPA
jgi:hypothetical protein